MNSFHVLPGEVEMIIGEPIPTTGLRVRDMDKLAAQVRAGDCRNVLLALEGATLAAD